MRGHQQGSVECNDPISLVFDDGTKLTVERGTIMLDVLARLGKSKDRMIVAAYLNNKMKELTSAINYDATVRFVTLGSLDGLRVYQRSASFILIKALYDLAPGAKVSIQHSLNSGLYCEITDLPEPLTTKFLKQLEKRMKAIVDQDIPIERDTAPIEQAIQTYKRAGKESKARLMSFRSVKSASIYKLSGQINYFYGYLTPSTGYIKRFSLKAYDKGFVLRLPSTSNPTRLPSGRESRKLFSVFQETGEWLRILEVEDVGMLNEVIRSGDMMDFVLIAEALHEKKIAQMADMISSRRDVKVVLTSGPSASGKTTFMKRLAIQLRVNGFKPIVLGMDDYFIDREKTPLDSNGEHDFESPYAMNIDLFRSNLKDIIAGKEIRLPSYNFKTGKSSMDGEVINPSDDNIILIEGIHALNPMFAGDVKRDKLFKIYISALTQLNLDSQNRIPTTDTRILRRMVRDFQFRGYSATETLLRWPSVRDGEAKHIFPFQEEADVFFNSSLVYEFAVLRGISEKLLCEVTRETKAYAEAHRLLKFLSYFLEIPKDMVPRHSLLREFMGSSSFRY